MEKPTIKISKLSLEADGNIIGDCFVVRPEAILEQKLGTLFGIIEIYNNNDSFTDSFLEAISDLKTEYYLPPFNQNKSAEKRFEEALARANRRIHSAFNQSVEEVDLRTVSAVVGVAWESQLFFTSVGRIKGLFARTKKNGELMLIDVLAGAQETKFKPEPEKIFANIMTGELSDQDGMLFINEELLGVFSQHELGETILNNEPEDTTKLLDETIKQKVGKKNYYAITLRLPMPISTEEPIIVANQIKAEPTLVKTMRRDLNHSTSEPINRKPTETPKKAIPPQQSIDRLLYTQVKTEKYLAPSMMPNWQKIAIIGGKWIKLSALWVASKGKIAGLAVMAFAKTKYQQKFPPKPKAIITTPEASQPPIEQAPRQHLEPLSRGHLEPAEALGPTNPPVEEETETPDMINDFYDADFNPDEGVEVDSDDNAIEEGQEWDEKYPEKPEQLETEEQEATPEAMFVDNEPEETSKSYVGLTPIKLALFKPSSWLHYFSYWINLKIADFLQFNKLQRLAIAVVIVLVFLFCQSIVVFGRASDGDNLKSTYGKIAIKIQDQLNSAEARNIFNDEAGAVESLNTARELFATIPNRRSTKALIAEFDKKIKEASEKLQKISYQDPQLVIDFAQNSTTGNFSGLAKAGNLFWVFDNSASTLKSYDAISKKIETKTTTLSDIKKMTVGITDNNILVLVTNSDSYFRYDISANSSEKFKPTKSYFQIKTLPLDSPLVNPSLASSTPTMSLTADTYSLVLDSANSRLVIFDKNNILKRQFISDKLKTATVITADIKNKLIWFFADNKIFSISIDF